MADDEALVAALKTELAAYVARGLDEKADGVRAELKAHGIKADSPKRSAKESPATPRKTTSRSRKTTER